MKTIIIVYTLAMIQGFIDAKVTPSQCFPQLVNIYSDVDIDLRLSRNVGKLIGTCKKDINASIILVQLYIDGSGQKDNECFKPLDESLGQIRASYVADLDKYDKAVENTTIGSRTIKFRESLKKCFNEASNCSDIPSCLEELEDILYGDETVTKGQINPFLRKYESDFPKKCASIKDDVNKINANLDRCYELIAAN